MGFTRVAHPTDVDAVTALRLECYLRAKEFFVVDLESLAWRGTDPAEMVLGIWDGPAQLVSTTSARAMLNSDHAREIMECEWMPQPATFPALLLGKGATREEYGRRGLHSLIRFYLLEAAAKAAYRSLVGIVYEGAPRTRLMERIGYRFSRPGYVWYTDLDPLKPTLIATLPCEAFESALRSLDDEIARAKTDFPLVGEGLDEQIGRLMGPEREAQGRESGLSGVAAC